MSDDAQIDGAYETPDDSMELLQAGQILVGNEPTGRPLISNGDRTIYVDPNGGDDSAPGTESEPLATIQAAIQRVPIYLRHQYTIDLATVPELPVTYDEDVLVPTILGTGQAGKEQNAPQAGPIKNLVIRGQQGSPEAVEIGSFMFGNVVGTSASQLLFVTLTRDTPYDDEEYGLTAYGTGEVHLYRVRFTDGPTKGVIAYGSKMKASFIDLGQQNLQVGIRAKRHGSIMAREVEGETTGPAYSAVSNSQLTIKEGNRATGNPRYRTRIGGTIYDLASNTWQGLGGNTNSQANNRAPQSDGSDYGDIWYEDGSGEAEEGFYGQTRDGPVRLG